MPECSVMISVPCALCGSSEFTPYLVGRDRLLDRFKEYAIVRCCNCGFRYLSPRPNPSEFDEHYPPDYPPHQWRLSKLSDRASQGGFNRFKWRIDSWNLRRTGYPMQGVPPPGWAGRWLAPLRRRKLQQIILPPHGRCRMLDVGCGTGLFLYRHRDLGWETWGVEASHVAAEVARRAGLRVITGQIESADLPQGYFDLIIMMHVLEHLENPTGVLARLRPLLAQDGQLMIEVPNADSWGLRFWGTHWSALELPRHLSHFRREDLERLAVVTGYRIVRYLTRFERDLHVTSLQHWLRERTWLPAGLRKRELARYLKLNRWFSPLFAFIARGNAGDVLRVWLEPVR